MPHDPSLNHLRRVYVRRSGCAASSLTGWRRSEPSDGRTILVWSSTEVMGGMAHRSKSIEITLGMSWRTSRTRARHWVLAMWPGYSNYETVTFLNG